ncbi:MAG: hypothetical protein R3D98_10445 [Candidatus Krumholzibacteriia bacterium]
MVDITRHAAARRPAGKPDDGQLLDRWSMPGSPWVTCPAFVDRPGGMALLLTTAAESVSGAQRRRLPDAGTLRWVGTTLAGPVPAHAFYGDDSVVECPEGSGQPRSLSAVADELSDRLIGLFTLDLDGRSHGAAHQTGWTGLVATLLGQRERPPVAAIPGAGAVRL